jgi:hypothetical protein
VRLAMHYILSSADDVAPRYLGRNSGRVFTALQPVAVG